ncbi:hypothetical protein CH300_20165 [Rhodococcus sp. 15-1154-1]|nr:hypothetical protein [Rhodococcus sp. 15-1154-1]OZF00855.1 hypothetical protein CH300_20165 [Rhodococcus sp. 15-1154-1]
MRRVLPYPSAAVRDFLKQQTEFTETVPADLIRTGQAPRSITRPFLLCRPVNTPGRDPLLKHPVVQVEACTPPIETYHNDPELLALFGSTDPEELAWDISCLAGEIITRARGLHQFRNGAWKGEWVEGPLLLVDKSRTGDFPIYRAPIRVELDMRTPR